ncbi:MAG: hypothetical protein WCA20_20030 [Candidatus Sulfotelmatobacter sp.]
MNPKKDRLDLGIYAKLTLEAGVTTARDVRCIERLLRRKPQHFFVRIKIEVVAGLSLKVDVRIDEARKQRSIAKVNDLRIDGNRHVASHGLNVLSNDDD